MKIFPNGEREAVEWLGESGFLNVVFDKSQFNNGWLRHVGISRKIIPNCGTYLNPKGLNETEIRNYVKVFEIDYISLREINYNSGMPHPFGDGKPMKIFAGIEAKYFYASSKKNEKYHTGVGQLLEYLKWGLDIVMLVHIFDSDIGRTKINEFIKPALGLISCLRDTFRLSIGYACLIVDEKRELHRSWDLENSVWAMSGTEQNPFKTEPSSIKIRESIETAYSRNFPDSIGFV